MLPALALDLEVLPHLVDMQEALNEQRFTKDPTDEARGDAEAALAAAEVRVELELETPAQLQTPLEPHAAVAVWDGDELTAWVSTQGMFTARDDLATALRAAQGRTFACSPSTSAADSAASRAPASRHSSRPSSRGSRAARCGSSTTGTREQLDGGRRAATRQTVRLGARRDGTIAAIDADAVVAMGQGGWIFPVLDPGSDPLPLRRCPRAGLPREDEPPRRRTPSAHRG